MEKGFGFGEELGEGDRAFGGEICVGKENAFQGCVDGEVGPKSCDLSRISDLNALRWPYSPHRAWVRSRDLSSYQAFPRTSYISELTS